MNTTQSNIPKSELPPLLTTHEVATLLRCSKAHISKLMNGKVRGTRRLPSVRLGRRVLIRKESLDAWILELAKS